MLLKETPFVPDTFFFPGEKEWKMIAVEKMKLESTIRPRGRPKKST